MYYSPFAPSLHYAISSSAGIRFPSMLSGPWAKRHHNHDKHHKEGVERFTSIHSYSSTTTTTTITGSINTSTSVTNNDPNVRMMNTIDTIEASIYSETMSPRSVGTDYSNNDAPNVSLFLTGEESDYDDFDSAGTLILNSFTLYFSSYTRVF